MVGLTVATLTASVPRSNPAVTTTEVAITNTSLHNMVNLQFLFKSMVLYVMPYLVAAANLSEVSVVDLVPHLNFLESAYEQHTPQKTRINFELGMT